MCALARLDSMGGFTRSHNRVIALHIWAHWTCGVWHPPTSGCLLWDCAGGGSSVCGAGRGRGGVSCRGRGAHGGTGVRGFRHPAVSGGRMVGWQLRPQCVIYEHVQGGGVTAYSFAPKHMHTCDSLSLHIYPSAFPTRPFVPLRLLPPWQRLGTSTEVGMKGSSGGTWAIDV